MSSISEFIEDKYYVSTGTGKNWSDYEGPFNNLSEAFSQMSSLCGDYASPEMVRSALLTYFSNNMLDLVKDDNGNPINGRQVHLKNTIYKDGQVLHKDETNA